MTHLTTRKSVLGILLAFLLAFGFLHGNPADALTLNAETSRDGQAFHDLEWMNTTNKNTFDLTISDVQLTDSNVTESFTVSVSGARFPYDGSNRTSYTWRETARDGTIVAPDDLLITVQRPGEVTLTVLSTSPNDTKVWTFYVVQRPGNVSRTATLTLAGLTNGVSSGNYDYSDELIYNGDSRNYLVEYTVTGGNHLYVREGSRLGPLSQTLTTSSRATVYLQMEGSTRTVTANVLEADLGAMSKGVYIFGAPTLSLDVNPGKAGLERNENQDGDPGNILNLPFWARVTDGTDDPQGVKGVLVGFDVRNKSATTGGTLIFNDKPFDPNRPARLLAGTLVDSQNRPTVTPSQAGTTIYVQTNEDGVVECLYQLGTAVGEQFVDITAVGFTKAAKATVGLTSTTQQISIASNQSRPGNSNVFDLIARVENGGTPVPDQTVTFRESLGSGTLTNTPADGTPEVGKLVKDETDALGRAQIVYNAGGNTGAAAVIASISSIDEDGIVIYYQEVTFSIRGGTSGGGTQPTTPIFTPVNRLAITPTSASGQPNTTQSITISSVDVTGFSVPVVVSLSGSSFTAAGGSFSETTGITPFTTTLTLPNTAGTYSVSASATGYTGVSTLLTVEAPSTPGALSLTSVGNAVNGAQTVQVTAQNADGTSPTGTLTVTLSGLGFVTRTAEIINGSGNVIVTLPTTAGTYTLAVGATGYRSASTLITVGGTTTPTTPAGAPSRIEIDGPAERTGTAGEVLTPPLRVRVLDANDTRVADANVRFRILSGQGRLSDRGNGRGHRAPTDAQGYARADLTPLAEGSITVLASVNGVSETVRFEISVGDVAETRPSQPGLGISPIVHVPSANRPPMLWIDGGKIYVLVGAEVQEFAPGIENAMNIAIGGGKVYWTEQTGESSGTINAANLDGTGATELKSILAVPMGIAVDTAVSTLYWTNSRGRIQSASLDGASIQNVKVDIPHPMDIAVARGTLYWTEYDATAGTGNIGMMTATGQRTATYLSTGPDAPGSLAIAGGNVYWTEMTGTNAGTINAANLDGTGATELASIRAAPSGIAVDTARSKLYWTNARGRIQAANLDGSKIQNVVDGLGTPGDMVLSNAITAPRTAAPTTPAAKYDVNGDGSVDNMDAGLVAEALGTDTAKYDVNGDGTVNFLDLLLVFENRDADAASAPTVLGMNMTAVQMDRIQEQIDLLVATGDRSPVALRTLMYLQQLLVTARPEQTQLFANYPNPFNPETWIPYELAAGTHVRITIYNPQGVVIRTLDLGQQSAGYYTDRDRAAYWDGRNALGEQVASGIYFYQLETDEMSSMRKMVILK